MSLHIDFLPENMKKMQMLIWFYSFFCIFSWIKNLEVCFCTLSVDYFGQQDKIAFVGLKSRLDSNIELKSSNNTYLNIIEIFNKLCLRVKILIIKIVDEPWKEGKTPFEGDKDCYWNVYRLFQDGWKLPYLH